MTSATDTSDRQAVKKKKKGKSKKILIGSTCGFFAWFMWWGFQLPGGTIQFGICKTYLETILYYPHTLRINSVEDFDRSLRIHYVYIDPFGQSKMDFVECVFKQTVSGPSTELTDIKINRKPISKRKVMAFSRSIPGIVAYPPDLTLPGYNDVLKNIVIETKNDLL